MSTAQARHERTNGMLKRFCILKDIYRHDLKKHEYAFKAMIVFTQVKLREGSVLASQEVNDIVRAHQTKILKSRFGGMVEIEFNPNISDGKNYVLTFRPMEQHIRSLKAAMVTQSQSSDDKNGDDDNVDKKGAYTKDGGGAAAETSGDSVSA